MGTELKSNKAFAPQLRFSKVGETFKGKLIERHTRKIGGEEKNIYVFAVIEGTVDIAVKKDSGWAPVDVNVGDLVELLPSSDLANKLPLAEVGQTITIRLDELKKVGKPYPLKVFYVEAE